MLSIYALKAPFQALLRPVVRRLAAAGISANAVTVFAALVSCALGALLVVCAQTGRDLAFLALPIWMLLRMALNAIDGLLAREHHMESTLGAYLNELCDVVSDAALYLPFAFVAPFGWAGVSAVIFLSVLSEFAGALGASLGGGRRYDGPMGKSDRAAVFGGLGLLYAWQGDFGDAWAWCMPIVAGLIVINIFTRVRRGVGRRVLDNKGGNK